MARTALPPGSVIRVLAVGLEAAFCAISSALAGRSAGSFSSDFATAAATFGGTAFRNCVTGAAGSVMIFMMICCALTPTCGGLPVSISYNTEPRE